MKTILRRILGIAIVGTVSVFAATLAFAATPITPADCQGVTVTSNVPTAWLMGGPQTDHKFIQSPNYPQLTGAAITITRDSSGNPLPIGTYSISIPVTAGGAKSPSVNGMAGTSGAIFCHRGQSLAFAIKYADLGSPEPKSAPSGPTVNLALGTRGVVVAMLQKTLINGGYLHVPASGNFDASTQAAVVSFQKAKGLPPSGNISLRLDSLPAVATPFKAIQPGAPVLQVIAIQKFLVGRKYLSAAAVTGSFNAATQAAIIAFQKARGLSQTGIVDSQTFNAMNGGGSAAHDERGGPSSPGGGYSPPSAPPYGVPFTPAPNNSMLGYFDTVSARGIAQGWALDANHSVAAATIGFYVDAPFPNGKFLGEVIANGTRADVDKATGYFGNYGWSFSIPAWLQDGKAHTIYTYATASGATRLSPPFQLNASPRSFTLGAETTVTPPILPPTSAVTSTPPTSPVPAANRPPIGYDDVLSCATVQGWTCDPDSVSNPLTVEFYMDKPISQDVVAVGRMIASGVREAGVGNVCGGNSAHGFSVSTPAALQDGKTHKLYVYAVDHETGATTLLSNSPQSVTCASGLPPQRQPQ